MKKKTMYTEMAYVLGIVILALGTALMEKADFGMSMVVAPAYLLHLKISQTLPFFSFGMAEYTLQAVVIVLLALVMRRFRLSYLFSFCTAVIYGFVLDGVMLLAAPCRRRALCCALRIMRWACCFARSAFRCCSIPISRRRRMSCS